MTDRRRRCRRRHHRSRHVFFRFFFDFFFFFGFFLFVNSTSSDVLPNLRFDLTFFFVHQNNRRTPNLLRLVQLGLRFNGETRFFVTEFRFHRHGTEFYRVLPSFFFRPIKLNRVVPRFEGFTEIFYEIRTWFFCFLWRKCAAGDTHQKNSVTDKENKVTDPTKK